MLKAVALFTELLGQMEEPCIYLLYGIIRNSSSSIVTPPIVKKLCQQIINETKDNGNVKDKDLHREAKAITLSTSQGFTE